MRQRRGLAKGPSVRIDGIDQPIWLVECICRLGNAPDWAALDLVDSLDGFGVDQRRQWHYGEICRCMHTEWVCYHCLGLHWTTVRGGVHPCHYCTTTREGLVAAVALRPVESATEEDFAKWREILNPPDLVPVPPAQSDEPTPWYVEKD
jgi:hypothetical protein